MTAQEYFAISHAIDEAGYAMVGGNLDGELIPPKPVSDWLSYIRGVLESQYFPDAVAPPPATASTDFPDMTLDPLGWSETS